MTLHMTCHGAPDAPALIFLHGSNVSSWMWSEQYAQFEADYYCIGVDLPACGQSHGVRWESLATTAQHIAAIIRENAAGGKAHIVGYSLGGYVALMLLAEHPDCVLSVAISGVTTQPFERKWFYRTMINLTTRLGHWEWFMRQIASGMQLPPDAVPLFLADNKYRTVADMQRAYAEILDFTLPAVLQHRQQRVLAVAGERETATIVHGLRDFQRLLPAVSAYAIPNGGHIWIAQHPTLFNAMLVAWLTGQPMPSELTPITG